MKKRHQNLLEDLLEAVAHEGQATIEKWRLTRWYDQERFSVGIRRDVRERWEELSEELKWISKKPIAFFEVKGQIVLMFDQTVYSEDE